MIPPAKIQVRFADLDLLGHVNNAVYLNYFEMARVHYFRCLLGTNWDWKRFGVVLVRNEIDYKRPVLLSDEPVIFMFTEFIGNKSFGLTYDLKVNDLCYASGKSVLVCLDTISQKTIPVSQVLRKALEVLNG